MTDEQELLKAFSELILSLAQDGGWTDEGTLVITLNTEKAMASAMWCLPCCPPQSVTPERTTRR